MKASTIKALLWGATVLVAIPCIWQLVDFAFLGGRVKRTTIPNTEDIRKSVKKPDAAPKPLRPPKEEYEVIKQVNVSGVRPKAPVEVATRPTEVERPPDINPLDTVVGLRGVWIDGGDPTQSVAIVFWKDPQISSEDKKKILALKVGTWLPKPYDKTYRLKRVEPRKAIFEVAEEGGFRELPAIALGETRALIPTVAASRPGHRTESGPAAERYAPPAETLKIAEYEYLLSEKDTRVVQEKGLEMIGRDVHTAPYLDPKTKKPEGIIVKSVRQDSLPAKLGLRDNDIVRGVNNTAIRSNADIYSFAKANPDVKEVSIAIERFGRTIHVVYRLP